MPGNEQDKFGLADLEALAAQVKDAGKLATGEAGDDEEDKGHAVDVDAKSLQATVDDEPPIIRIAHKIIQRMILENADAVAVCPVSFGVSVRFRVDGSWHEVLRIPRYVHSPLVSRFKIMSNMNIAERKAPQSSTIHIRHAGKDYDLACHTMRTVNGEKVTLSVVYRDILQLSMEQTGMSLVLQQELLSMAKGHRGLVLMCGKDDRGIDSTMYSLLRAANDSESSVATIEDPVRMPVDGWSQTHVDRKVGLNVAVGLKYLSKQEPDIAMASILPDIESSEVALSLANDSFVIARTPGDSIGKALSLYGEYFRGSFILPSLRGVLRRASVRLNCQECSDDYAPSHAELQAIGLSGSGYKRGVGCESCRHCGYRGSVGVYEYVPVNEEIYRAMTGFGDLELEISMALGELTIPNQIRSLIENGRVSVEEGLRALR